MSKQKIASAELVSSSSEKAGTNGVDKNNLTIKTNASGKEIGQKIWAVADKLRGAVDSWDFKQYIFNFIFYKACSDLIVKNFNHPSYRKNIKKYFNVERYEDIEWSFDEKKYSIEELEKKLYDADIVDVEQQKNEKIFLLPHMLFSNVCKNAEKYGEEIINVVEQVFKYLNDCKILKGMFANFDFDNARLGNKPWERKNKIISIIEELNNIDFHDYHKNSNVNVDPLGDAFEFVMSMYASNGGKSGGEFYTPQKVSELLARLATANKKEIKNVYDPACGSGSLLLKINQLKNEGEIEFAAEGNTIFYGHEINLTTSNLCRMNMILHNVPVNSFKIACMNTLLSAKNPEIFSFDQEIDVIVSNPPYSIKWKWKGVHQIESDIRFSPNGSLPYAPESKADLAFIMHSLHYLNNNSGTAAIVCFPGIFYREGAELEIRKYLVVNNYVDAVISLPSNLFFGTSISTCVLILNKGKKDKNILFIDASNCFEKGNNKNILRDEDISFIVDLYKKRKNSETSYLATLEEIDKNKYNLTPSRYVVNTKKEVIDIIKLEEEIKRITARSNQLRKELDEILDKELRGLLKELGKEDQMPKKN